MKDALMLFGFMSLIAMTSSTRAAESDLVLRAGLSSECPSKIGTGGGTAESLTPFLADALVSVGTQAVGSLIDALGKELTASQPLQLTNKFPVSALLKYSATPSPSVEFLATASCLWVAVSDKLGVPTITADGTGNNNVPVLEEIDDEDSPELAGLPILPGRGKEFQSRVGVLKGHPLNFYLEAKLMVAEDRTAWGLMPSTVFYPKFLTKNNWYQKDERDFAIVIQFARPGSDNQPFSTLTFSRDNLKEGAMDLNLIRETVGYVPFPQMPTTPPIKEKFFPVNVSVMLTETKNPAKLSRTIGNILLNQKDKAVSAANSAITKAVASD